MNVGLFFGSFNPIHVGHLIIAQFLLNETDLNEVWMVVSPHNPLKEKSSLARDHDRLRLVQLATEDNLLIKVSDIEFHMPTPSYTIDTLVLLKEKHPDYNFTLIMGGDNLQNFKKWKNYDLILKDYTILIYNRPNYSEQTEFDHLTNIKILDAPLLNISSTRIRELLKSGKSVQYMVPDKVLEEIISLKMYK